MVGLYACVLWLFVGLVCVGFPLLVDLVLRVLLWVCLFDATRLWTAIVWGLVSVLMCAVGLG